MVEYVALGLGAAYILYLFYEHWEISRLRRSFQHVIHVNGIRGKSTVARLIGACLREQGIRTFTKVTGTKPMTIACDGTEKPIKRLGPANIREQVRAMRWAKKNEAEVLVIECMAVKKEYQALTQQRILRADMAVITNVRSDHQEEFGSEKSEIAKALAQTIPSQGILFTNDESRPYFHDTAEKLGTKSIIAPAKTIDIAIDMFPENIALAMSVAETFGITSDLCRQAMKNYGRDVGSLAIYKLGESLFVNAFSINDAESILEAYYKVLGIVGEKSLTIVMNNRPDRPLRAREHLQLLQKMSPKTVFVTGGYYPIFKKGLAGVNVKRYKSPEELNQEFIFGMGNIRNHGYRIIEHFKTKGNKIYG